MRRGSILAVMYCTVLYCAVLYCTVLCCTVLYCTVLVPRAAMMIWSVTVPDDVELDPTQVS